MTHSVLIVDDEPMACMFVGVVLERAGFNVSKAKDGFEALDKICKEKPDLVILDVMMPGMDGFTVCETLRSKPETATLPIIFLSAKSDRASANKGYQVGGTLYLMKPISPEELTQHVREVLEFNEIERRYSGE